MQINGLSSRGSSLDMLNRIRTELTDKKKYDKVFKKVWGTTGGFATGTCMHGIVYCLKFVIRTESPRDYGDMLLSLNYPPNIVISDIPQMLARHMNIRVPFFFHPNEGRAAELTEENVEAAESGELSVSFPWLQNFEEVNEEDAHPVSGSSEHYSLYDRFHEKNSSDRYEILRRVTFVKELCGRVNTQTEEQLHSQEVKNNYFLNMMKSTNHLFLFRSITDRRNEQINSSQRQLMSKKLGCDEFILDQLGRLHSSNALKLGQMGKRVESNRSRNDNITPSSMSNSTEVPSMPQGNQQFMAPQNNNPKKQSTISSDDRYLFHLRSIIKVDNNDARLTSAKNDFATIQANRNFWGRPMHVKQLQMVMEVLDERKDAYEPIITVSNKLLTRSDSGRWEEIRK